MTRVIRGRIGVDSAWIAAGKASYGQITAINLDKGEILWRVAHGETPDGVRTNALLKGLDIPRTGRPGIIGVLTTKTLVIAGESGTFTNAEGKRRSPPARLRQGHG